MRSALLASALLLSPVVSLAAEERPYDDLRDLSENQPLRIQDATPEQPGPSLDLSMTNLSESGETGLFAQPQVNLGLPFDAAIGVDVTVSRMDRTSDVGPVQAYGQLLLMHPEGRRPGLGVKATAVSPTEDAGLSGLFGLFLTQELGNTRVHANGNYLAQGDTGDRYLVGLGVDTPLSERVLLLGDGYWEKQRDREQNAMGLEGGAAYRFSDHLMVQAAVGLQRSGTDLSPRAVLLLSAD